MSGIYDNAEVMEAIALELGPQEPSSVEAPQEKSPYELGWRAKLNPIQKQAYEDPAIYKLYYGERGTGKSHGGIHELVEDAYLTDNCLNFIVIKEISMATQGGAWHKLQVDVLPEWKQGNNLVYTESRLDSQTKNPYIWIRNIHGGWSMIMLVSLPVASQVQIKIRGREPHMIFVDEGQALESDEYFSNLLMQLGRRRGSERPSKLVFACNPEGPSHWLYNRFFIIPVDEKTGEWNSRYAVYHIPYSDNEANLEPGYYENYVLPAVANDPILKARLVDGEWVDRPEGDSLFEGNFVEGTHIVGNAIDNEGLLPVTLVPIIISYDPGAAHTVVYFEQVVPTLHKIYKVVFDELDYVGQYTPYIKLVPKVIERLRYWEEKMQAKFQFQHVSDSSAFNQYRAATGSFDAWDIEKISVQEVRRLKEKLAADPKYKEDPVGLQKAQEDLHRFIIKMKGAPKGDFSVEARVRMVNEDLVTSSLMVSATCPKAREMFLRLTHEPDNRLKPKKKARYGHNLDAMTYGFFWAQHKPGGAAIQTGNPNSQYFTVKA